MATSNMFPKCNEPSTKHRLGIGHWRVYGGGSASAPSTYSPNGKDWYQLTANAGPLTLYDVDLWIDDLSSTWAYQIPINNFVGIGAGTYKQEGVIRQPGTTGIPEPKEY